MRLGIAIVAAASLVSTPVSAQDGYALYTQWEDTTLDQAGCKRAAERALRRSSFTDDFLITENSVDGRRKGDYTAAVRCVSSKQMVFFVISGPKGSLTSKYIDELVKNY